VIVRAASFVTLLVSICAAAFLVLWFYDLFTAGSGHPRFWRELLVCTSFTVLPAMFIWASVQAWRYRLAGIVSLCSGWLLFGFLGSFVCLFHFFERPTLADAMYSLLWLSVFAFGIVVGIQHRRFRHDTA
jgi:hypothetical protein